MTTLRNERGSVIVLYAVSMVAIIGMAALAVDLGMLRKSKAEAQRGADAAALAGASAFQLDLNVATEVDSAITRARRVAEQNYMNGVMFDATSNGTRSGNVWTSDEVTIEVFPEESPPRVSVKARRAAVSTWFAQIFGINSLPVGAKAAAVADYAAGTNCVKPIAIADMWGDGSDLAANGGNEDHFPSAGETWVYDQDPQPDVYQPADYDPAVDGSGTGLGSAYRDPTTRDWGLQIMVRPGVQAPDPSEPCLGDQGNKCYYPGWWGLWGGGGTSVVREMFKACTPLAHDESYDEVTYAVGTDYPAQTGWTAISHTVEDLYGLDQGAYWDPSTPDALTGKTGTVAGSAYSDWRKSPRVWIVAAFDPGAVPAANEPINFNNFMLVFFEGCMNASGSFTTPPQCGAPNNRIVARFLGRANGTATGPVPGTMIQILRLVE